jgi:peptidoglycan/LPS O-acetylase OafA/YrhL
LNTSSKNKKRNIGIDVLRGFSILLVILLHLSIHFNFSHSFIKEFFPKKLFSFLFWNGIYGVIIFFTLSGFLITSSILKKWGSLSKVKVGAFYWMRFARIIPPLAALLLLLFILHVLEVPGFTIKDEQTTLGQAIFAALTFHFNWLEIQVGYLPANWDVLWSISIEESFYIFFPLICLLLKKEWHFVFFLILFLVLSPWARTQLFIGNDLGDRNHLAYLDSIALGCITALIVHRITLAKWLNQALLGIGWGLIILVLIFKSFIYQAGVVDLGLNVSLLSLGVAFILFWMHDNHREWKERNWRALSGLRYMGIYSYEIYLTHMFPVIWGVQFFKYLELGQVWLLPFSLLILLVSSLLGYFFHHYLSEPLNVWLRKKGLPKAPY